MHKAIVAKIDRLEEIKGADFIQVAYVVGEVVIVNKEAKVGDIGVFFQPDLQLSEEFCHENNLFRDSSKNKDENQSGFFDTNRRVRAQPFRKVKSEGFFVPFSHFDYTNTRMDSLGIGFQFDEVNGYKICQKFISEKTRNALKNGPKDKKGKVKPETPMFERHVDTEQFKYFINSIPKGTVLNFQSKLHGTSARYANTWVEKGKDYSGVVGFLRKVRDALGNNPQVTKGYEYVAGTRRVVLFEGQEQKEGYNGPEQWRFDHLEALKPHMNKGLAVYGEIVGYANGAPIMGTHSTATLKDKKFTKKYGEEMVYSYGCHQAQNRFFIYRITQTTKDGTVYELTPSQVMKWAKDRDFEHTFRVHEDIVYDGDKEALFDLVMELTEREDVLCEDWTDTRHVSEGIVIRVDGEKMKPKFYKNKSKAFKIMEGIYKEDNVDLEDAS
jgi:hypothetical protein